MYKNKRKEKRKKRTFANVLGSLFFLKLFILHIKQLFWLRIPEVCKFQISAIDPRDITHHLYLVTYLKVRKITLHHTFNLTTSFDNFVIYINHYPISCKIFFSSFFFFSVFFVCLFVCLFFFFVVCTEKVFKM